MLKFKKRYLLAVLSLIYMYLVINTLLASAHEYNTTDGRGFNLFPETALSEPLDPKTACHPSGIHCLMLVYENNTFFGRGVKLWLSTDYFKSVFGRSQIGSITVDYSSFAHGYYDNFHLPYDVSYISSEGKYYFFVSNTVYSFDGTTLSTIGTFGANQAGKKLGLGFINGTLIRTFEAFNIVGTSQTITSLRGTVISGHYSIRATWAASTNLRQAINLYDGTAITDEPITGCIGVSTCQVNTSKLNQTNFPSTYTGLDYFDGAEIGYQRFFNSSWKTATDDLISFGSPTLTYEWNRTIDENITNTDAYITADNKIYSYKRDTNESIASTTAGVWVYNLPLISVTVFGEGFDPGKKITESVNLSVSINCTSENFQSSDTGTFARVRTPCNDGNALVINSFTYRPISTIYTNFTIPSVCNSGVFVVTDETKAYIKPYDFTITYFDSIFGNRVEGVATNLDGETDTTNANGQVTYEVFPINNESFTQGDVDTDFCSATLTLTGTSKLFNLISSKSGYTSSTENFVLAEPPFDIETDFVTSKNIFLTPINTIVNVKVFSKDGVEIFPSVIEVVINGSNETFWSLDNELFETNTATKVPARFILLNNTGTFEINATVNYFGQFTETVNVTTSEEVDIEIFINRSSWELPCNTASDCSTDLCTGQFYKKFLQCGDDNECKYQSFDCGVASRCDQRLGCVDLVSINNCTIDRQCNNTCLDDYRMLDNRCGFDGICKGTIFECLSTCNNTLGYCQEMEQCVNKVERTFKAGFIRPSDGFPYVGEVDAFCDFSQQNKYECVFSEGYVIERSDLDLAGATLDDVVVDPDGWEGEFINNGQDLKLYAVSVFCDQFCNLTWEFCQKGCDIDTGRCRGTQKTVDDTLGTTSTTVNLITGFWNWWDAIFPDIHSQSFAWLISGFILLLLFHMIMILAIPKKSNLRIDLGAELYVIFLFVWLFVGSVAGRFYNFAWIVITVIAIVYLVNYVRIKRSGG